jgi:PTS system galactitol-specific IIA component
VVNSFVLDPNLILGAIEAKDDTDVIRTMAAVLLKSGYVMDTYADAVLAREREFPTGLPTEGAGVAIPHCDPGHVITPTVAFATLVRPVTFGLMAGEEGETVEIDIVMMLAIKDPEQQIEVLRRVCTVVQDPDLLIGLKSATSKEQVLELLQQVFAG